MNKTLKQLKFTFTSISLLVLLCISAILLIAQVAFAQTGTTTTELEIGTELETDAATTTAAVDVTMQIEDPTALREARIARREEMQTIVAERRASGTAQLETATQTRITARATHATALLTEHIAKLQESSDRLRTYIDTRELETDTVRLDDLLNTIDGTLADASASAAGITIGIEFVITSDTPSTDWQEVRAEFIVIRELIKDARTQLTQAIMELKRAGAASALPSAEVESEITAEAATTTTP